MKTNLDRIEEGEIDLHGSSLRNDHGLCGSDHNICEVYSATGSGRRHTGRESAIKSAVTDHSLKSKEPIG